MRRLHASIDIAAPASDVWPLLTHFEHWPVWGPTVRNVTSEADRVAPGVTGRVRTIVGLWLPFEITSVIDGYSWDWRVARIDATGHRLHRLDASASRVVFSVPWMFAPYLAILRLGLTRLKRLAERDRP